MDKRGPVHLGGTWFLVHPKKLYPSFLIQILFCFLFKVHFHTCSLLFNFHAPLPCVLESPLRNRSHHPPPELRPLRYPAQLPPLGWAAPPMEDWRDLKANALRPRLVSMDTGAEAPGGSVEQRKHSPLTIRWYHYVTPFGNRSRQMVIAYSDQ